MTEPTPIRFMVSDVDGTLVDPDKDVTPEARDAVHALRDAGVGFAFVSSRPPRGLAYVAGALQIAEQPGDGPGRGRVQRRRAARRPPEADRLHAARRRRDARIAIRLFASLQVDIWLFTMDEWLLVDPAGHYVAARTPYRGLRPSPGRELRRPGSGRDARHRQDRRQQRRSGAARARTAEPRRAAVAAGQGAASRRPTTST